MAHPEFLVAALMVVAGAVFVAKSGEPPRRETDTAWVARFVPEPGYESQMAPGAFAELQRFAASEAFGDAHMRGALEVMHDPEAKRERGIARAALKEAGGRAGPMLLESIADWRYPPPAEPSHPDSPHPWDFAVERLAMLGTRELVPLLLAAEREGRIPDGRRTNTDLYIAAVGAAESVEPTLRALDDPDQRVRGSARVGIAWALRYGNLGPEMRAAIFEPLLRRTMEAPVGLTRVEDVHVLLRVDRARAIRALMTDGMLSASNPRLGDVLMAFTYPPSEHRLGPGERFVPVAVPPERLWALWRRGEADGPGAGKGLHAGAVLCALALSDPERTRPVAERLFAEGGRHRDTAISALRLIENLPEGSEALRLWEVGSPGARAPLPILYVDAVENVFLYQALGGVSYFLEVYDDWKLAAEGFRALGLPECADAVEWVAGFYFGPDGPPDEQRQREQIVGERERTERESRLIAARERVIEEAASAAHVRMFEYMREHRAVFENLRPRVEPEWP